MRSNPPRSYRGANLFLVVEQQSTVHNPLEWEKNMFTKTKAKSYLSKPVFTLVLGLLLCGTGILALIVSMRGRNILFVFFSFFLVFSGIIVALYGFFRITDGKKAGRMLIGKTVEDYLLSPGLLLAVGLLLGSWGLVALSAAGDDTLFQFLGVILTILGFSVAAYGLMGTLEGKPTKTLTKKELEKVRELSQNLKVRYPTYILQVHKLKERHETLHEKFQEVRTHSEEFKERIRAFQTDLTALETQLHDNLQKHAPIMNNDSVDGVAKKILWSEKQLELTQLETTLKTLAETESPTVPEDYRSGLNRIRKDFKKLDSGVTLYHELLTACTKETDAFDTVETLKTAVEEIDVLTSQHEAELLKLETDTQTRYELSKMAISMFEERFRAFKTSCEF